MFILFITVARLDLKLLVMHVKGLDVKLFYYACGRARFKVIFLCMLQQG